MIMNWNRFQTIPVLFLLLAIAGPSFAQNTGGVFGPRVDEGHKLVQYRVTLDPDTDGWAQRLHYEESLNGDFMLRGVVQTRKTADSDMDFDYFQGELFWDFSEDGDAWQTGLRFDARIRGDDRPDQFGLNWMNHWNLANGITTRFLVLTVVQTGDNAVDGVILQTRGSLYRRFENGPLLGFELYNSYGTTEDIRDFDDQTHQLGPGGSFSLGGGRAFYANVLFGLTDASPDTELRLWLTARF